MPGLTPYGKQTALNALLTASSRYVSLHTGDPGANGANELPTGGGYSYARKQVTFALSGNPPVASNTNLLRYDNLPPGDVGYVAVWDAASGGNCLWSGPLNAARSIAAGMSAEVQPGEIVASIS